MLVEDRLHERLVELVVTVRVTVPAKLLIGITVIAELVGTPALTVTLVGLAVTVKSGVPLFHSQVPVLTSEVFPPTTIVSGGGAGFGRFPSIPQQDIPLLPHP